MGIYIKGDFHEKRIGIALAIVLLFAFATGCCSVVQSTVARTAPPESKDAQDAKSETATEDVLTMGTNAAFPPYKFYEGGEVVGIDVEIARAIADKLGLELVVEDMEFDSAIQAIETGRIDIGLAGMTVTPERSEAVSFTESYATGVQAIIV